EELKYLLLARREVGELLAVALLLPLALELAQHATGNLPGEHRLTCRGALHRCADFLWRHVLQEVADGTRLEGREHPFRVGEPRQHDDGDLGMLLVRRLGELDPALARISTSMSTICGRPCARIAFHISSPLPTAASTRMSFRASRHWRSPSRNTGWSSTRST